MQGKSSTVENIALQTVFHFSLTVLKFELQ